MSLSHVQLTGTYGQNPLFRMSEKPSLKHLPTQV